ncbi:MAG: glycosyltransferase family 39 protein [Candidatus Woesearchaeota archaeon]
MDETINNELEEKREEILLQENQIKGEVIELKAELKSSKEKIKQEEEFLQKEKGELVNKGNSEIEKKSITKKLKGKITIFLKNKYNLIFLIILLLALLIRLKYIGQESIWNDAAVHLWYSIRVIKEPWFLFNQQYFMGDYATIQTIVALFYLFTKNAFLAGKIVATLYALTGIIFMYLLGSELKNKLTGLIASVLLAFNHIFLFYSVRPLADSPLLVTTIILLYCMVKLEKTKKISWGITSGIMFLVAMFTKVQSSLFVFALLIYYLLFKRKEMIKNKATLMSWLIPVGFILFAHLIGKLLFGAAILDRIFGLFLTTRGMPYGLEAWGMLKWIFSWYLIPFVFLGIILVFFYKKKEYYFSIILLIFYYLFFEINVDNTQDRYVLPLLSIAIILAVFSIEEIAFFISSFVNKKYRKILVTILVLTVTILVCWNYYQIADPLIYNKSFSYVGHQEAGEWMKANIPEDAPIFAGSYRYVRFFTEREYGGPTYEDFGGTIWNLRSEYRYANNKSAFEEDLIRLSKEGDVYLEIDHIEYTQPSWYYPLSEESFNYFASLGFNLVHVGEGTVLTKEGPQKTPMIFIFKKDKVSGEN